MPAAALFLAPCTLAQSGLSALIKTLPDLLAPITGLPQMYLLSAMAISFMLAVMSLKVANTPGEMSKIARYVLEVAGIALLVVSMLIFVIFVIALMGDHWKVALQILGAIAVLSAVIYFVRKYSGRSHRRVVETTLSDVEELIRIKLDVLCGVLESLCPGERISLYVFLNKVGEGLVLRITSRDAPIESLTIPIGTGKAWTFLYQNIRAWQLKSKKNGWLKRDNLEVYMADIKEQWGRILNGNPEDPFTTLPQDTLKSLVQNIGAVIGTTLHEVHPAKGRGDPSNLAELPLGEPRGIISAASDKPKEESRLHTVKKEPFFLTTAVAVSRTLQDMNWE